jgi:hypothetical protein
VCFVIFVTKSFIKMCSCENNNINIYYYYKMSSLSSSGELLNSSSDSDEESFVISYKEPAINAIIVLSTFIQKYFCMWELIKDYKPSLPEKFTSIIEQKIATYVATNNYFINNESTLVTEDSVVNSFRVLILNVLTRQIGNYLVSHDQHAKSILKEIFDCQETFMDIILESIRFFIKIRKNHRSWLPVELWNVSENNIYVDNEKCPIDKKELEILYKALGSRKYIYVKILLGSLYELSRHLNILQTKTNISIDDIMEISNSSWFPLFLFQTCNVKHFQYCIPTVSLAEFIKINYW